MQATDLEEAFKTVFSEQQEQKEVRKEVSLKISSHRLWEFQDMCILLQQLKTCQPSQDFLSPSFDFQHYDDSNYVLFYSTLSGVHKKFCCFPYFTRKTMESQKVKVSCPRSYSQKWKWEQDLDKLESLCTVTSSLKISAAMVINATPWTKLLCVFQTLAF